MTVKFDAGKNAESFVGKLMIVVADRDPSFEPEGMAYELIGEACIPGIQTSDFINIFEEQSVHRSIEITTSGELSPSSRGLSGRGCLEGLAHFRIELSISHESCAFGWELAQRGLRF